MPAQPNEMPFLQFTLEEVVCTDVNLGVTNVIPHPDNFQIKTELEFDGWWVPLLTGQGFEVVHHVLNIETNTPSELPITGTFTVGSGIGANPAHIAVISGPYTTGTGGANLNIPAGFAAGTFRVTTHVHALTPGVRPIVAAFDDSLVIEVV